MNRDPSMTQDKFELHYRQQLSALIDGELAADETRFLLRRLEHDSELSGCQERWQLAGDVLRGAACAPAPIEFAARVREALAAEPLAARPPEHARSGWRWGGGAALAASMAALALFMARERLPDRGEEISEPIAVLETTAQLPSKPPGPVPVPAAAQGTLADAAAAAPVVAVAAVPTRRKSEAVQRRGNATRTSQAVRGVAARRQEEPQRQIAAATAPPAPALVAPASVADPFAHPSTLRTKPWPRSVIVGDGALNASFRQQPAFYPFEPTLPAQVDAPPPLPQR